MIKLKLAILFFLISNIFISNEISIDFSNEVKPIVKVKLLLKDQAGSVSVAEGQKYFAVFMVMNDKASHIPLSGIYAYKQSVLSFTSINNLGRGLEFEIQVYKANDTLKQRFKIPEQKMVKQALTTVIKFYPTSNEIPGNILRFHIQFSNPMLNDEMAFMNVKILNDKGEEIKMMWRHKSYWINETILVMMIHPGRVKRGITNYSELGPSFEFGKEYTMLVTAKIKDIYQRELAGEFKRKFKIGADDRTIPSIQFDSFGIPEKNTTGALKIVFNEGMDYVSVLEGITIIDESTKEKVEGQFQFTDSDSVWLFKPAAKWKNNDYEIQFDKEVTDLASNYLHRLFEITNLNELNEDKMPIRIKFQPK